VKFRSFLQMVAILSTMVAGQCLAQSKLHPRILILVTSADRFANGQPTGLWLEEYAVPYNAFAQSGFAITVVSPKGGVAPVDPRSKGTPEQEKQWAEATKSLQSTLRLSSAIRAADFDGIFIPGGHGPLFDLATDEQAIQLISQFAQSGKQIASVCHGPAALVAVTLSNGEPLVKGRRITSFSDAEEKAAGSETLVPFSVQQKLAALGAQYSQGKDFAEYAVADGNLITGQNPSSSAKVADMLIHRMVDAPR